MDAKESPTQIPLALTAGILIAAALLAALSFDLGGTYPVSLHWLILLSGVVIAGLIAWLRMAGWRDLADPITFYPVLLWIVFGAVEFLPEDPAAQIVQRVRTTDLVPTFALVLLGMSAFLVAYAFTARPTGQIVVRRDSIERLKRRRLILVVGVILASQVGLIALGNFGYLFGQAQYQSKLAYTGLLNVFVELMPVVLVLITIAALSPGSRVFDKFLLVGVFVVQMGLGFFSGTKTGVVLPVLSVLLGILYSRGRLPWKFLGVGLLIFLFLVPGIERYRELLNSPGSRVSSADVAADYGEIAIREVWQSPDLGQRVADGYYLLVGRLNELRAFSVIRVKTPVDVPYEMGKNYWTAPLFNIVPRILWPSKPVLEVGAQTAEVYYQSAGGTAITRTTMGDFYANFGLPGVIGGMALIGWSVALIRRRFVEEKTIVWLLVYVVAFFVMLNHEQDFASILAGIPRTIVLVLLLGWFVTGDSIRRPKNTPSSFGAEPPSAA